MKATAQAPSNIAFVKYWGRKDEELRLPENGSISMNLSTLLTTTTVEFGHFDNDEVIFNGITVFRNSVMVKAKSEKEARILYSKWVGN